MVALYFDYRFVDLLNDREDLDDPIVYDFFNQFLRKIRGVEVFVNLNSLKELEEKISSNKYWNYISEIAPIKLVDFKALLGASRFYKKDAISKILFTEGCDEKHLQETYSTIFISNNSLREKWPLFSSNREDSELLIKSNPTIEETGVFKGWTDFSLFLHPITSFILFDLYVASDKYNQKIKDNLIPLVSALLKDSNSKTNDLTIFTKDLASPKNSKIQGWKVSDIEKSIDSVNCLTKVVDKIDFIRYDSQKVKTDIEHNRFILTNYFFIRTEAGFNIFKQKKGEVNKRDNIRFDSLLNNRNRNIAQEIINNLKLYTSQLAFDESINSAENNFYFIPPLKSRFFKDN